MFWVVAYGLVIGFGLFFLWTRKYSNPFKLYMVFGSKGAGKTTMLFKLSLKYRKKGFKVFCTDPKIPGCYYIPPEDIGFYKIPGNSVLLVEEVGRIWYKRDFKNFKKEVMDWFRYQRHEKVRVWMYSQDYDVDAFLRSLCDGLYLLENKFNVFSYGRRINKRFCLVQSTAQGESRVAANLEFDPLILAPFGARILTFNPKYFGYFDSFDELDLPIKDWDYIPFSEGVMDPCQKKSFVRSLLSRSR